MMWTIFTGISVPKWLKFVFEKIYSYSVDKAFFMANANTPWAAMGLNIEIFIKKLKIGRNKLRKKNVWIYEWNVENCMKNPKKGR